MLTSFDDYPIHQTAEPVAHPGSGDRNFYDRYFFNGHTADGSLFFAAALGLYPNRRVMDAAFSVVRDGVQTSAYASRLAPDDRAETSVGPIRVEVVEPLRRLRISVGPNDAGITADLEFAARSAPLEEPRFLSSAGTRVTMDSTRLTQFGRWSGTVAVGADRVEVDPASVTGCRDRSWGVRAVGEPEGGAPSPAAAQIFWLWAPIAFADVCTHLDVMEHADGRRWHSYGVLRPDGAGEPTPMAAVSHQVRWQPGTRRSASATLGLEPADGEPLVVELEPLLAFQMLGLGYFHPEWGHGRWHGESAVSAVGADSWRLADLDPLDPRHIHVQQLCRARLGDRVGTGVFEQLCIGAHRPSGFTDLFDGAAPAAGRGAGPTRDVR